VGLGRRTSLECCYRLHIHSNLTHALIHDDWQILEELEDINSKVAYFNSSVIAYLDFYLPIRTISRCINNKPWVTDQFRRFIRCIYSTHGRAETAQTIIVFATLLIVWPSSSVRAITINVSAGFETVIHENGGKT
jgi:hypothetical protein